MWVGRSMPPFRRVVSRCPSVCSGTSCSFCCRVRGVAPGLLHVTVPRTEADPMQSLSMLLTFLVGVGLVVQIGLNAAVGRMLGGAIYGTIANFVVGLAALVVFFVLSRHALPARVAFAEVPAYAWLGGLFGAAYVGVATFAGPRLGALLLLALTVGGQMVASVIVDHYGLLGFQQHPVTLTRLVGIALLLLGIWLVAMR
ncbi:MAG: DMT family transporter [Gammaproteobacteria bacterium]|nr:DMT family transporter [Gammaproteobacteria bacterium]